jgi:hypothetical protein
MSHRCSKAAAKNGFSVSPFPDEGVGTIYEMTARAFKLHASKACMGTRTYEGPVMIEGKPKKQFGETVYRTYEQVRAGKK